LADLTLQELLDAGWHAAFDKLAVVRRAVAADTPQLRPDDLIAGHRAVVTHRAWIERALRA
jgi:hypothetical protein